MNNDGYYFHLILGIHKKYVENKIGICTRVFMLQIKRFHVKGLVQTSAVPHPRRRKHSNIHTLGIYVLNTKDAF